MKDCLTLNDFWIGLISGTVLSILIWLYQLVCRKINVIRVVLPDIHQNRIGVLNVSLWKITNFEIKGQISYLHGTIRNRNTFLIEDEKSYISPEPIKGLSLSNYFKYHFLKMDLVDDLHINPRYLIIDMTRIVLTPPIPNPINGFIDLQNWRNVPQNQISELSLNIFVSYYGRITNTLKYKQKNLPIHN